MGTELSDIPLAVTLGDPCGIGPDVILKTWLSASGSALPGFFVIGSKDALLSRADIMGIKVDVLDITAPQPSTVTQLAVLDTDVPAAGVPGRPEIDDARSTIKAIELAVDFACSGKAGGVVTAPINKKALYSAGFEHPGHTEFLAELATPKTSPVYHPVMMLAGPELRTVPVTIHIPLDEVPGALNRELIELTARIVARDLKSRFGLMNPRLVIAGLNPHAGEQGAMGKQDIEVIAPAVERLKAEGLDVVGPLPADTMFHAAARSRYDVALCMYHDQALIPAKTLAFDDAVNVTLGLPFIRTSPDHGTAYDIAGTGKADPASFMAALTMAEDMKKHSQNG